MPIQTPTTSLDHKVDVFYVYPTMFGGDKKPMNMDIKDVELREAAQKVSKMQVGVFTEDCNLFAPYYRQMSMNGLRMSPDSLDIYFSTGYSDVKRAFKYYLDKLNQGRPFIIAGHSQGSMILIRLMKEMFYSIIADKRMIAADRIFSYYIRFK